MTVQAADKYIIDRDEKNYLITAERLRNELGGERAGVIMAFYQASAPYGWEQLPDGQYTVGSTVKSQNSIPSGAMFTTTGSNLEDVMKTRVVPIKAHSHGFTDHGHSHGGTSTNHNHGLTDPSHNHTNTRGMLNENEYTLQCCTADDLPATSLLTNVGEEPPGGDLTGTTYTSTRGGLTSSKTGISVRNGSGSGNTGTGKTGISINNSADNSNDFSVKYSNVILCRKK